MRPATCGSCGSTQTRATLLPERSTLGHHDEHDIIVVALTFTVQCERCRSTQVITAPFRLPPQDLEFGVVFQ